MNSGKNLVIITFLDILLAQYAKLCRREQILVLIYKLASFTHSTHLILKEVQQVNTPFFNGSGCLAYLSDSFPRSMAHRPSPHNTQVVSRLLASTFQFYHLFFWIWSTFVICYIVSDGIRLPILSSLSSL